MTRPDEENPSEETEKDLELSKETLEDLDPEAAGTDVKGGGQTASVNWYRGVCQEPNHTEACNASG